jgi:ubiquinol-cytochrome c reductase cytochrome c1 subunit
MRLNRLTGIGLTEAQIRDNLMFAADKVGDTMKTSMTAKEAKPWFGVAPPDLSVIARSRSPDWLYTYLRTFYRDPKTPTGWNNVVFPNVAMPNVLWQMEGPRTYTSIETHEIADAKGNEHWVRTTTNYDADGFQTVKNEDLKGYEGESSQIGHFDSADPKTFAHFESNVADLSNFLGWMAEPSQLLRKQIGVWVMLFLFLFLFVAVRMNAAYWKHVR